MQNEVLFSKSTRNDNPPYAKSTTLYIEKI